MFSQNQLDFGMSINERNSCSEHKTHGFQNPGCLGFHAGLHSKWLLGVAGPKNDLANQKMHVFVRLRALKYLEKNAVSLCDWIWTRL